MYAGRAVSPSEEAMDVPSEPAKDLFREMMVLLTSVFLLKEEQRVGLERRTRSFHSVQRQGGTSTTLVSPVVGSDGKAGAQAERRRRTIGSCLSFVRRSNVGLNKGGGRSLSAWFDRVHAARWRKAMTSRPRLTKERESQRGTYPSQ